MVTSADEDEPFKDVKYWEAFVFVYFSSKCHGMIGPVVNYKPLASTILQPTVLSVDE